MRWRRSSADDAETPEAEAQDAAPPSPAVVRDAPDVPVDLGTVEAGELARAARRVVARALTEDLAGQQDLTSALTVPVGTTGRAVLVARAPGTLAGLDLLSEVCAQVDHRLSVRPRHFDGDRINPGDVVAEVEGPLRSLLTAERTALNLVCHLSGVATRTRTFADLLEGTRCVVRDTRKTTPGLRLFEKRAVAVGGGANHRIGLYDAVLVKDNHVAAAGSVTAAARAALEGVPEGVHVQVEVTSLAEAEEALELGVTDLLLDNFTPDEVREAVAFIEGRAAVEASGGITLDTARAYAEAGADRLAVGALTHSAPSLDLALDVVDVEVPTRRRFATVLPPPAAAAAEETPPEETPPDVAAVDVANDDEPVPEDQAADDAAAEDAAGDDRAADDVGADADVDGDAVEAADGDAIEVADRAEEVAGDEAPVDEAAEDEDVGGDAAAVDEVREEYDTSEALFGSRTGTTWDDSTDDASADEVRDDTSDDDEHAGS